MRRNYVAAAIAAALAISSATSILAAEITFQNEAAPIAWKKGWDSHWNTSWDVTETLSGEPIPAPAPFDVVGGARYRLGDPGVQFYRYQAGGVQIILGDCEIDDDARLIAERHYNTGAYSELWDCDGVDNNHTQ